MSKTVGFFGGSATRSTTHETSSQQSQQTQGGVSSALNFGNIGGGKKSTTNVTVTDLGAITRAFNATDKALEEVGRASADALAFGAGAITEIGDATEDALLFSAGALQEATAFSEGAVQSSFEFSQQTVDSAIAASETARIDSLEFAAGVLQQSASDRQVATDVVTQTQQDAFLFSAGALNEASGIIEGGLEAVDKAVGRANQLAIQSQENALVFSAGALQESLGSSEELQRQTLGIVSSITDKALTNIGDSTANTLSSLAEAQSKTIAQIGETSKSESAQSFDRLVKLAGGAFIALGLLVFIMRR